MPKVARRGKVDPNAEKRRLFERRMIEIDELVEKSMITDSWARELNTAAAVEAGITDYDSLKRDFLS